MYSVTEIQQHLDVAEDTLKLSRLRSMQWVAAGLLGLAFILFCLARSQSGKHPAWGYLAAFSEAAMVGALADWFAVVALFRHPLNIPIWHTAIIPNSKDDIARNLGEFVENHFITEESITERIRKANPAGMIGAWLLAPENSPQLGRSTAEALKKVLNSLNDSSLSRLLQESASKQLAQIDISATAGNVVNSLMQEGKHQELLDSMLEGIADYLGDDKNRPQIVQFMTSLFEPGNPILMTALTTFAPRILASISLSVSNVRSDENHQLRTRFDAWVKNFVLRLEADPDWYENITRYQKQTLSSPQAQALLADMWPSIKHRLLNDLTSDESNIAVQLTSSFFKIGQVMVEDDDLQKWLNHAIESGSAELVRKYRGEVGKFIENQLAQWTKEEMTNRIELAIGRDLQFIRINGTLVGGLVGIIIHIVNTSVL